MKIASPKAVRARLAEYAQRPVEVTQGDKGAVVGAFHDALQDAPGNNKYEVEEMRYLVWGFCFGKEDEQLKMIKSGDLADGQIFALKKWVGFYKNDLDEWEQRETFRMEVRQIFALTSMLYMLDEKGETMTLKEWLSGLEEAVHEIEKSGMVQSAVDDLGGVITGAILEPPDGYIPL